MRSSDLVRVNVWLWQSLLALLLVGCTEPNGPATPPPPLPPAPMGGIPWSLQFASQSQAHDHGGFDMDASGNVLVWMHGEQAIDFGPNSVNATGSMDWFLGKFDIHGQLQWIRHFEANGLSLNIHATFDEGDPASIVVTIRTNGPMTLEDHGVVLEQPTSLALMKLDADGEPLYIHDFAAGQDTPAYSFTRVRQDGHVFLGLTVFKNQTIDFSSTPLSCTDDMCSILAELDTNGVPIHARMLPEPVDTVNAITFGSGDDLVIAGQFSRGIDFGDGPHPCTESMSPYVVKLPSIMDPPIWTRAYCGYEEQWATSATVDKEGNVYFAGEGMPPMDFGGGPLEAPWSGNWGAFVVKLAPDGSHLWSRIVDAGAAQKVALGPNGGVFVGGHFFPESLRGSQVFLYVLDESSGKTTRARRALTPTEFAPFRLYTMSVNSNALMVGGALYESNDSSKPAPFVDFGTGALVNKGGQDLVVSVMLP